MNATHYIFRTVLFACLPLIFSCSSGPAEKPLPESISSPAHLLDQGIQYFDNNNYTNAIHAFEKALLQYRSIDDQTGIAKSCMNLANAYMAINNNMMANEYLLKADFVLKQSSGKQLDSHLHLLKSSLAIKKGLQKEALNELSAVLNNDDPATRLAALKNRTRIAFISDAADKQQWLEKYKALQQTYDADSGSHLARIYRFEAQLNMNAEQQTTLLSQALNISRDLADRPAIAATLSQWAEIDTENNQLIDAEDKLLRALFIRHGLGDVNSSLDILKQLQKIYKATNDDKLDRTETWVKKLSTQDRQNWENLLNSYDNYPPAH